MSNTDATTWFEPSRWAQALRLSRQDVHAFPNWMTTPTPSQRTLPRAWLTLLLLFVVTLLPRVGMAVRIPTICADGTLYVTLAQQQQSGRFNPGEAHTNNLYPRILSTLHAVGFSWEAAGKTWGVLCGALVVLPLFGWVRRQFNDRVAIVACLIYAAHPELIEWSPELVRDQTFWLLFTASLYFLWRATVEVSVPFHIAAAVTVPLCMLIRLESLVLLVPWVWWTAVRLIHLQSGRRGFIVSWAAVAALFVVGCAASGKTGESFGNLAQFRPWQRVQAWWSYPEATEQGSLAAGPAVARLTLSRQSYLYVQVVTRGLTELTGLLILVGLFLHARLFFRSDQLPPFFISIAICVAIWIHLWHSGGEASSRYSLAVAILGTRCAAICLMRLVDRLAQIDFHRSSMRTATMLAPLALFLVVGSVDALDTDYENRLAKAELGRWIQRTYGDNSRLAGEDRQLPIVGFYAHTGHFLLPAADVEGWVGQLRATIPDVVLISRRGFPGAKFGHLLERVRTLGLELTEPNLPTPLQDDTTVLSRIPVVRR